DGADRRLRFEQARDVVRYLAGDVDAAVEATRAHAMVEDVPDAHAGGVQTRDALGVGELGARVVERAHEGPEEVVLVRVGLAHLERAQARHRAEHEHLAAGADLRREARNFHANVMWLSPRVPSFPRKR